MKTMIYNIAKTIKNNNRTLVILIFNNSIVFHLINLRMININKMNRKLLKIDKLITYIYFIIYNNFINK